MLTKLRLTAIATLVTVTGVYAATATNINRQNNNQKTAPQNQNAMQQQTNANSKIDMGKLSEAFGNFIGRNLKTPGVNFDLDRIVKGMRDGAAGKPSPLNDQEYEAMMTALQEQVFEQLAQDNLKAANDFLGKNAKAKGVFELEPGKLQYILVQEGKGPAVQSDAKPMINYTGRYLDGSVFDTSENMGGPVAIPLGQTIPGFSRAIVGMKEGEKRKIFIHPDLGYGTQSPLPPNSLLIFDVEVVKVNSADKKAQSQADEQSSEDIEIMQAISDASLANDVEGV